MKRYFIGFFVLALIFALTQAGIPTAFAEQSGDYTYTINGSTAQITGYTGGGGTITIPRTLGGLEVTIIK